VTAPVAGIDTSVPIYGLLTRSLDAPVARVLDVMLEGQFAFVLSPALLRNIGRCCTWLARTIPCWGFAETLAGTGARVGAGVNRYSLHRGGLPPPAPRRFPGAPLSVATPSVGGGVGIIYINLSLAAPVDLNFI
jgi:hypothetical protein